MAASTTKPKRGAPPWVATLAGVVAVVAGVSAFAWWGRSEDVRDERAPGVAPPAS